MHVVSLISYRLSLIAYRLSLISYLLSLISFLYDIIGATLHLLLLPCNYCAVANASYIILVVRSTTRISNYWKYVVAISRSRYLRLLHRIELLATYFIYFEVAAATVTTQAEVATASATTEAEVAATAATTEVGAAAGAERE